MTGLMTRLSRRGHKYGTGPVRGGSGFEGATEFIAFLLEGFPGTSHQPPITSSTALSIAHGVIQLAQVGATRCSEVTSRRLSLGTRYNRPFAAILCPAS